MLAEPVLLIVETDPAVNANGEDAVAVEEAARDLIPDPRTRPGVPPGENACRRRAEDVPVNRVFEVALIGAADVLPQAAVLHRLAALAVLGPDLPRLPHLVDPIHVRIVKRVEHPPLLEGECRRSSDLRR